MYIAIVYESLTGHVTAMAEGVAEGVRAAGVEAKVIPVAQATLEDVENAAGCIMGSYTSYGILAGRLKSFLDKTFKIHGRLEGKVGGAFASSGGVGGGNETTVISILQAMLVHGMVIQGQANSPHFGPVAIDERPDEPKTLAACRALGQRVAQLAKKLNP